jgi:hypothetical protein
MPACNVEASTTIGPTRKRNRANLQVPAASTLHTSRCLLAVLADRKYNVGNVTWNNQENGRSDSGDIAYHGHAFCVGEKETRCQHRSFHALYAF